MKMAVALFALVLMFAPVAAEDAEMLPGEGKECHSDSIIYITMMGRGIVKAMTIEWEDGDKEFLLVFITGEAEMYGPATEEGLFCDSRQLSPLEFYQIMMAIERGNKTEMLEKPHERGA